MPRRTPAQPVSAKESTATNRSAEKPVVATTSSALELALMARAWVPLAPDQVDVLTAWVKMGAPWPANIGPISAAHKVRRITDENRAFWSFQPPRRHDAPAVKDAGWVRDPLDRPTVGDWLVVPPGSPEEPIVEAVLPRRSVIVRNAGGDERDVTQALAANVDTAFLALPLDGDRNPRRTDRFIALVRSGGVEPVLVLTKSDRAEAGALACAEEEAASHGVPVHAVSARTGVGLDALAPYLRPGRTVVLLGVSGAGKSTLVNRLLGAQALPTGDVRRDGRGRHREAHEWCFAVTGDLRRLRQGRRNCAVSTAPTAARWIRNPEYLRRKHELRPRRSNRM